jgi:hypothetical protein
MSINYTNIFHARPSKIDPNWDFWLATLPCSEEVVFFFFYGPAPGQSPGGKVRPQPSVPELRKEYY